MFIDIFWDAVVGESLTCRREPLNPRDRYTLAVMKNDVIIGHLPAKVSRICSIFLRRGGSITCRRYSADLPQGGMEIPCKPSFTSSKMKEVDMLRVLFNK